MGVVVAFRSLEQYVDKTTATTFRDFDLSIVGGSGPRPFYI